MKLIQISAVWCMSCIVMNEIIKKIDNNYETILYDYDIDKDEIEKYNVGTVLPVYILITSDGNEIARSIGEKSKKELTEFLNGGIN